MSRWVWVFGLFVALLAGVAGIVMFRSHSGTGPSPSRTESRKDIHIEVLNGCGINGIAGRVGQHLRGLGFDVMAIDNAETFTYPESIVIDRAGKLRYARQVAGVLGIANCIQQINPDPFRLEEVTVIIGRDYRRLKLPDF